MLKKVPLVLVLLAFAACAQAPSPPLAVSPGIVGAANTLRIDGVRGMPATAAIDMPDMQMPAKTYALHQTGPHTYEAGNVAFSMAGTWRISVQDAAGKRIARSSVEVK